LLHHDHQVHVAEPEAADRFREHEPRRRELRDLAPEVAREAVAAGVAQLADALQGRPPGDELARRLLEELLLLGEHEVHPRQSGSPRTRLAMMFSWISEVPPSIVL